MTTRTMAAGVAHGLPVRGTAAATWGGRVLTGVPALFLAFDGVTKLLDVAPVREAMAQLGFAPALGGAIGVLLLACLALHLNPRTAVLGLVLLTGYLGGAVAAHVRVENPLATHTLFPVYVGALLWAGLLLRQPRLRVLFPLRRG